MLGSRILEQLYESCGIPSPGVCDNPDWGRHLVKVSGSCRAVFFRVRVLSYGRTTITKMRNTLNREYVSR